MHTSRASPYAAPHRPLTFARPPRWHLGHRPEFLPPARGFDRLLGRDGRERKFTITSAPLARAAYPRAHTCFNRVDLPLFGSREDLARAFDVALAAEHAAFSMD